IPLPHRVKSPPEQYAVSVRFGIAEGPAVFRVLLRSAPPVGVSWRMAYTMETSRTTIACLLVEYSSSLLAASPQAGQVGIQANQSARDRGRLSPESVKLSGAVTLCVQPPDSDTEDCRRQCSTLDTAAYLGKRRFPRGGGVIGEGRESAIVRCTK